MCVLENEMCVLCNQMCVLLYQMCFKWIKCALCVIKCALHVIKCAFVTIKYDLSELNVCQYAFNQSYMVCDRPHRGKITCSWGQVLVVAVVVSDIYCLKPRRMLFALREWHQETANVSADGLVRQNWIRIRIVSVIACISSRIRIRVIAFRRIRVGKRTSWAFVSVTRRPTIFFVRPKL